MVADSALLDRYSRRGDPEAFAELVRRYAGLVYGTCLRTTGNPQDAEDVAQECFLELARKSNRIGTSLPGWLHQVAKCKSIDLVRREVRRKTREDKAVVETGPQSEPAWAEILPYVDDALAALPEILRAVVLLHYFDGLSQKEIAERLGISQATVSRDLNRSVSELRKHLAKLGILISGALLIGLVTSNAASSAPNTLVVSATKIGLSGVGHGSAATSIFSSMAKIALPYKILGAGVLMLIGATLTIPALRGDLPGNPGQFPPNASVGSAAGVPSKGGMAAAGMPASGSAGMAMPARGGTAGVAPNAQLLIDGELARLIFDGQAGGSYAVANSDLRFDLIGPGSIRIYRLGTSGRFRVFGTVQVRKTNEICRNGYIDKVGKVISTEK
jgi:RNA polymerase sigma factor (sigma-70 family)